MRKKLRAVPQPALPVDLDWSVQGTYALADGRVRVDVVVRDRGVGTVACASTSSFGIAGVARSRLLAEDASTPPAASGISPRRSRRSTTWR